MMVADFAAMGTAAGQSGRKGAAHDERPDVSGEAMLQGTGAIVAGLDRLVRPFDHRSRVGIQARIAKGGFIFALDIIFTPLDFLDDRLVVLAGECLLQIHEAMVGGGEKTAVIFRIAAQAPDFPLKRGCNFAPLSREVSEQGRKLRALRVLRYVLEALHTVKRGFNKAVQDADRAFRAHGLLLLWKAS